MATFLYPTAQQLVQIAQTKLPVLTNDDPIFNIFPLVDKDVASVAWEQQDNYGGLQQLRGLNGSPNRITKQGAKRYVYEPGYYGEFDTIDEQEITTRRPYGAQSDVTIDVSDLVMECQDRLITRRINRQRSIIWTLLTTGTFNVTLPNGQSGHTDTYSIQTYAGSAWSNAAAGTPLADFRAVALLARGLSTNLGQGATAFMNRTTYNRMVANTNSSDLGRLTQYGQMGLLGESEFSRLFVAQDLPRIVIYDDGYLDASNAFQLFIPTSKIVIVGTRPGGANIGEYWMTRNASNPNAAPGVYQKVVDNQDRDVPRQLAVHDGHNGGPVIFYPGSVVVMTVT